MRIRKREPLLENRDCDTPLTCLLSGPLDILLLFYLPLPGLHVHIEPSKVPQSGRWAAHRGGTALREVTQLLLMHLLLRRKEVRIHALVEVRWQPRLLRGTRLTLIRLLRLSMLHHP